MTQTSGVLVLATAGEEKVKRVVLDATRQSRGDEVVVGVRQPDAWRYEGLGCELLLLGEEETNLESLVAAFEDAQRAPRLLVVPVGFPRPGFGQLLRVIGNRLAPPIRVVAWGGLTITRRRLAFVFVGLVFLLLHVPSSILLRLLRFLDGVGLLSCGYLARCIKPRRVSGGAGSALTCQVINSLGTGGAQRQVVEYLRLSHGRGKKVQLLLLHRDPGQFEADLRAFGITVEVLGDRLKASRLGRLLDAAFPRVALVVVLWARLRQLRPDCVWSWLFLANVVSMPAGRLAGVPRLVASVRNTSEWKTWPQYHHWWFRPADHNAALLADATVVNARALLADHGRWARAPGERLVFIPNAIDVGRFLSAPWRDVRPELGLPPDVPVVLAVGRLSLQKDYPLLLRATARLKARGVEHRLLILGEGALLAELRNLAEEIGVAQWVRFCAPSRQPQSYYRSANVFALSSRFEGMPNVLLEAQLYGLPAVTTAAGGAGEVVVDGQTGFVVEIGDEKVFAEALESLLCDAPLRERFGREATRLVIERFSWEHVLARMDAVAEVAGRAR